jgi:hypothetical protein
MYKRKKIFGRHLYRPIIRANKLYVYNNLDFILCGMTVKNYILFALLNFLGIYYI